MVRAMKRTAILSSLVVLPLLGAFAACGGSSSTESSTPDSGVGVTNGLDGSQTNAFDGSTSSEDSGSIDDSGVVATNDANVDAGTILPDGLIDPVMYKSFADSAFKSVHFNGYFHLEDWEDGLVNTPGVTASSAQLGTSFGSSLVDSVDGDDGMVDGQCKKEAGTCNSGFAGGTISFTFDAAALGGQLPTHVGIVWTDGSTNCDAIFEAYDANDGLVDASVALIGTKTATSVGDPGNSGGVDEDRFFGVVHAAGVKRIVVKSSAGGVEVDHLQYGR